MKKVYSILFLTAAALMALLFGPIGLFPFVFLFLNISSQNTKNINLFQGTKKLKSDLILVTIIILPILIWYFISNVVEKKLLHSFFYYLGNHIIFRTSAVDNFLNFKNTVSLDFFGIQIISIFTILTTFIIVILITDKNIVTTEILKQKKIINDKNIITNNIRYNIFVLYSIFIFLNFIPYLGFYNVESERSRFIYQKYILFSAFLYPIAIMFDVLSIMFWTRNSKINRGGDFE